MTLMSGVLENEIYFISMSKPMRDNGSLYIQCYNIE